MSKIDTGGNAYPRFQPQTRTEANGGYYITGEAKHLPGMTALDYFAGQVNEADIKQYANSCCSRAQARYKCAIDMIAEKRRLEAE